MYAISCCHVMPVLTICVVLMSDVHVVKSGVTGIRSTLTPNTTPNTTPTPTPTDDDLSQQEALKYLEEYGYIDRLTEEADADRENGRSGKGVLPPTAQTRVVTESTSSKSSSKGMDYKDGIKAFQRRFHLPVTGIVDEATKAMMAKPRCGLPDYVAGLRAPSKNIVADKKQILPSSKYDRSSQNPRDKLGARRMDATTEVMLTDVVTDISTSYLNSGETKLKGQSLLSKLKDGNVGKGGKPRPTPPVIPASAVKDPSSESESSIMELSSIFEISSMDDYDSASKQRSDSETRTTALPEENVEATTVISYTVTEILSTVLNIEGELETTALPEESKTIPTAEAGTGRPRPKRNLRDRVQRILQRSQNPRQRRDVHSQSSSSGYQATSISYTSRPITWRVLSSYQSQHIPNTTQIFKTAFRRWAEVTPLTFKEKSSGDVLNVDISIAFVDDDESRNFFFTWAGTQLARSEVSAGTMFFNDEMTWTDQTSQGYNLLRVAVHEIGHLLGLAHSDDISSIMYPVYTGYNKEVPIDSGTRSAVQSRHGVCSDSFDTVFDWVRYSPSGARVYSTYFIRDKWSWLYSNSDEMARYGDPKLLSHRFSGVPDNIDAVVQILDGGTDTMYFFKGDRYWRFDHSQRRVYTSNVDGVQWSANGRLISEGWPAKPGSNTRIPDNIDASYYDARDNNIYFFKGNQVYAYDMAADGCCLDGYPKSISSAYPPLYSYMSSLPDNIDAAYYSKKHRKLFFFKGALYWENTTYNPRHSTVTNKVSQSAQWNTRWNDICNVE